MFMMVRGRSGRRAKVGRNAPVFKRCGRGFTSVKTSGVVDLKHFRQPLDFRVARSDSCGQAVKRARRIPCRAEIFSRNDE